MTKTNQTQASRTVTINVEQGLYVIPAGNGYSCLGFDVCYDWHMRLATEYQEVCGQEPYPIFPTERGTLKAYEDYQYMVKLAREWHKLTDQIFRCEMTPQLIGCEGYRVEVVDMHGETRRFKVGTSMGWMPIHLELNNSRSSGGSGASREYKSVKVIR